VIGALSCQTVDVIGALCCQTVDVIGAWIVCCALCSVQLARRVLQLERSNAALNKELDREKLQVQQLADQVRFPSLSHSPADPAMTTFQIVKIKQYCTNFYAVNLYRVTTCLENLEMSGNLKHVKEMSGMLLTVREMSGKNRHGKVSQNCSLLDVSTTCVNILDLIV